MLTVSLFSSQMWPNDHVRNARVSDYCGYHNGLVFSSVNTLDGTQIVSRGLLTNSYNLSCLSPLIQNISAMNTTLCLHYTSNPIKSSTMASVVSTSSESLYSLIIVSPSQASQFSSIDLSNSFLLNSITETLPNFPGANSLFPVSSISLSSSFMSSSILNFVNISPSSVSPAVSSESANAVNSKSNSIILSDVDGTNMDISLTLPSQLANTLPLESPQLSTVYEAFTAMDTLLSRLELISSPKEYKTTNLQMSLMTYPSQPSVTVISHTDAVPTTELPDQNYIEEIQKNVIRIVSIQIRLFLNLVTLNI